MNEFEKAYGELWSVLHNEPATEIEKRRIENIKLLESLKPLVKRATSKKPMKSSPITKLDKFIGNQQLFICPTCGNSCLCRYATNGRNENKYCYDCGQAIDWCE